MSGTSVVIPARNAARTLPRLLDALRREAGALPGGLVEILVVDDGSTDATPEIARAAGATVLPARGGRAGGARNQGRDAATGRWILYLDADDIPQPGLGAGVARAVSEHPGAIIGPARRFVARTRWEWVGHLQLETPRLARGEPREVGFLASFCLVVESANPLRFDETYGGEDTIFCLDARNAGIRLIFDPRWCTEHDPDRATFAAVREQQRRLAYELARGGTTGLEGRHKRILSRVPLHYFALLRLPVMYQRVRGDDELRRQFLRLLPRMVLAEWLLGVSALRYVRRRPPLRGRSYGDPPGGSVGAPPAGSVDARPGRP